MRSQKLLSAMTFVSAVLYMTCYVMGHGVLSAQESDETYDPVALKALLELPLWDGKQSVKDYASQTHLKPSLTIPIGEQQSIVLNLIPAAKFQRGHDDYPESPVGEVTLTQPYYIGRYEVTQAQFKVVYPDFKFSFPRPAEIRRKDITKPWLVPAEAMEWKQANEYAEILAKQTGFHFALPTEAQWEHAARAGTTTTYYWGNDPKQAKEYDWVLETAVLVYTEGHMTVHTAFPREVGKLKPNGFGLYDMMGNVGEHVKDWYREDYYAKGPKVDPLATEKPVNDKAWKVARVNRGSNFQRGLFPTGHRRRGANYGSPSIGLRLVVNLGELPKPATLAAAEEGDVESQLQMAAFIEKAMYLRGYEQGAFHWYLKAAEQGNALAQRKVGISYYEGRGVALNLREALPWLTKASDAGDSEAKYYLGQMYLHAKGVEQDVEQGLKLLKAAHEGGVLQASFKLGGIYRDGAFVEKDHSKAVVCFAVVEQSGDLDAAYELARLLVEGEGVKHDHRRAEKLLKKAAGQGHVKSAYLYGSYLVNENVFTYDRSYHRRERARELLTKAAQAGYVPAYYQLGQAWGRVNWGDSQKKSRYWLQRSAEAGDPRGMYELGFRDAYALGTERDLAKAEHWFIHAIEAGNGQALDMLTDLYMQGVIEGKGDPEAYQLLIKPESLTLQSTKAKLGYLLVTGHRDKIDLKVGLDLIQDAVNQKNAEAMYYLARLKEMGQGLTQDKKAAYELYLKSAKAGATLAEARMSELLRQGIHWNKNEKFAFDWALRAAKKHHLPSVVYVAQSHEKAKWSRNKQFHVEYWYTRAAELSGAVVYQLKVAQVTQDHGKKRQYFMMLADAKDPTARLAYARYLVDRGDDQQRREAERIFLGQYEAGDKNISGSLGYFYADIFGFQDYEKALKYLKEYATLGHPGAYHRIAKLYGSKHQLKADPEQYVAYLKKGIEGKHTQSAVDLARYYDTGKPFGHEPDLEKAVAAWKKVTELSFASWHKKDYEKAVQRLNESKKKSEE